jgi:catechol 2,3-dioxygenase-like lactoylglutathione lyase family enzyme
MLATSTASANLAVRDLAVTKKFYGELLGLRITEAYGDNLLRLHITGGMQVIIYAKDDHVPAGFTVEDFAVFDNWLRTPLNACDPQDLTIAPGQVPLQSCSSSSSSSARRAAVSSIPALTGSAGD